MERLREAIVEWTRGRGYRVAFGRPEMLDVIWNDIHDRRRRQEFDPTFYQNSLADLPHLEGADLEGLRSLIILSVPRPAHRLTFLTRVGPVEAVVPPTYQSYRTAARTREELSEGPLAGHRLVKVDSPIKGVATRLGLARYGRNNVTYVPEFGSYHQLVCLLTDASLAPDESTDQPLMSDHCDGCRLCMDACPTGAIGDDRFLLHTERCLTFWNENDWPWPKWLDPKAHNCLIGCLLCQEACPQNAGRLRHVPLEPPFTVEETERILAGRPGKGTEPDPAWKAIVAKLAKLGLPGHEETISRNLAALMAAKGRR